jgi:Helix-turn-helix domain
MPFKVADCDYRPREPTCSALASPLAKANHLPARREEDERPEPLLTQKDAGNFLRLSESWLAKARMRGDGPPYVKVGRAIRYRQDVLVQWLGSQQRLSTSEE